MATPANSVETFAGDYDRVHGRLSGSGQPWLVSLRRGALDQLRAGGFPGVRDEAWKYTNVLPILRDRLEPVLAVEPREDVGAAAPLLARAAAVGAGTPRIVFVNGSFAPSLSRLPEAKKLRVSSLRERLEKDPAPLDRWLGKYLPASAHGFAALGTAFLDDGAVIEIGAGAAIEEPIHVVYLSTRRERAYVSHPRALVVAGEGSSAVVVEQYLGDAGAQYLTNYGGEIVIGHGAVLGHVRIQDESRAAFHVARVEVEQAASSTLLSHAFGFGAALSRTEISVRLAGEEAECSLSGLYAVDGSRHIDHHLMIDHAAAATRSRQLYKGVLEDQARGVFTGRVLVRPGSQKIKAVQNNPNLLLGSGAVAETRPQLEIHADDVACNHGATVGRLSEEAMFYLLSRGIEPAEARRVLVSGFAAEVVEGVVPRALAEALTALIHHRMGELGKAGGAR